MTDHSKVSAARRQTRRQLLTGGTGALAAILAAEAIAPAAPARAGVDGDVVLGEQNSTDRTTSIDNLTTHFPVLSCTSNTGIAVSGFSSEGVGVDGDSKTGDGVRGNSGHAGRGVLALATPATACGARVSRALACTASAIRQAPAFRGSVPAGPAWRGSAILARRCWR